VGFLEYASVMILPALVTAAAAFLIIFLLFRKTLGEPLKAPDMEEHRTRISDKPALVIGLIHLGVCTALLVISSFIGVDMWLISLAAALSLVIFILVLSCIRKKGPAALASAAKRVPWEFIPFILSMFTIVLALSGAGITESLAHLLSAGDPVFTYGIASFLSANLINNIPMSVLFAFILEGVSQAALMPALYASVLGSNLCAVFTPVGALAGLMWMGILKKTEVSFSYLSFVKYGVLIALPALAAGLFILWCIV
ncbi:MAG TPA: ArsB/NhaD family transporter, partial [Methanocorpusculum sp.]|nr:ArsB/NhaD family transporter [Methanocorpusculum sp.]